MSPATHSIFYVLEGNQSYLSRRPIAVSQVTMQAMSAPTVVVKCSHIMLGSNMPRSLILGGVERPDEFSMNS